MAWRFLTHLSAAELIDYLLHEVPPVSFDLESNDGVESHEDNGGAAERAALLSGRGSSAASKPRTSSIAEEEPTSSFVGLNALEIAAVAGAKKFLSQRIVQKTVDDIWNGHIIFWESLSVHSKKKARFYNKARADLYCRLRVPKYQKSFEALFFALFLGLYYAVLVERNPHKITSIEVLLYIWIAAFAYDELGEFRDAGVSFYVADFWSLWDIGIIGIGMAYMVSRIIGLAKDSSAITDVSFDIRKLYFRSSPALLKLLFGSQDMLRRHATPKTGRSTQMDPNRDMLTPRSLSLSRGSCFASSSVFSTISCPVLWNFGRLLVMR